MSEVEQRFRAKLAPANDAGCKLWTAYTNRDGYGRIKVNGSAVRAHRFAWEMANGPIPAGMNVCHRCDTPACCADDHLFLGTDADNVADKVAKGRQPRSRGSKNGMAKLTGVEAVEIFLAAGTQETIAARYGVSRRLIGAIKNRNIWAHATEGLAA